MMYQIQKPLWDAGVYSGEYWSDIEDDSDYDDDDNGPDDYAYDDYDTESDW